MSEILVAYRVLDKRSRYHHSYVDLDFAIDCAKHIGGSVVDVESKQTVYSVENDKKSS